METLSSENPLRLTIHIKDTDTFHDPNENVIKRSTNLVVLIIIITNGYNNVIYPNM